MQKVPSNKRKNSGDGLAKFERAQKLFQDIENIIDQEIATTPIIAANYESNIARIKKTKRKRPGLIRNFGARKNRQVINDMEYDPETNTWIGNEEALSVFSPLQPALITNRGRLDKEKVVGKMVWDPTEHKWKGNEKDARKFAMPRKPALITPLGSSNYLQKEVQGMVFDPISMRWVGNDDEVDIFKKIDKLDDDGFAVGNEFHLPVALTKSFVECANRHKTNLSGWFVDGTVDKKAHLYAIRNMSILRIVRDVKQRTTYVDFDDEIDANVPERDIPTSPRDAVKSGNGNSADAAEDYDDLPFTGSAKLKLPEVEEEDWDQDFDMEPEVSRATPSKDEKPVSGGNNSKKPAAEEEDWDSDFAEADSDALKTKLKLPSPMVKKPFQMDSKRGSVIDLSQLRNNNKMAEAKLQSINNKPSKPVITEDDEDGFDLPPGPVRLLAAKKSFESEPGLDGMDAEAGALSHNKAGNDDKQNGAEEGEADEEEEEEEDWNDVDVPSNFPALPVKRTHTELEEWDNDHDIELPTTTNPLVLKKSTKLSDDEDEPVNGGDEDALDGLEIPEDFVVRLKR